MGSNGVRAETAPTEICGDCERGLDPAGVILPEASSTPRISSESLAAAGYFSKTYTGKVQTADESPGPALASRPSLRAVKVRSGPLSARCSYG